MPFSFWKRREPVCLESVVWCLLKCTCHQVCQTTTTLSGARSKFGAPEILHVVDLTADLVVLAGTPLHAWSYVSWKLREPRCGFLQNVSCNSYNSAMLAHCTLLFCILSLVALQVHKPSRRQPPEQDLPPFRTSCIVDVHLKGAPLPFFF